MRANKNETRTQQIPDMWQKGKEEKWINFTRHHEDPEG
jgi:hypothetical protein